MLSKLEAKKVVYNNDEYLFVSDIAEITGLQKTYIYLLKKKKTIKCIEKESITLVDYNSFINYLQHRKERAKKSNKTELISKIKKIEDEKVLAEIEGILLRPKKD
jgi:hypothetical protein